MCPQATTSNAAISVDGRRFAMVTSLLRWAEPGRSLLRIPVSEHTQGGIPMVVLGIVLLIVGIVFGVGILYTLGIVLVVVGAVLYLLGSMGHAVGGRHHYW